MAEFGVDEKISTREKAASLFRYVLEVNKSWQKLIKDVSDYSYVLYIDSLPEDDENIKLYYRDRVDVDDTSSTPNYLLAVHKPDIEKCPVPDSEIESWFKHGWDDYKSEVNIHDYKLIPLDKLTSSVKERSDFAKRVDQEQKLYKEYFEDDASRVQKYNDWLLLRNEWQKRQKLLSKTRDLFHRLRAVYNEFERDAEGNELIVADGFFRVRDDKEMDHPIITRRVKIELDVNDNTIYIEDGEEDTEIFVSLFKDLKDIDLISINNLNSEMSLNDYHPLDRVEFPKFLDKFTKRISSDSKFSREGVPEGWDKNDKYLIYQRPCFIMRKRSDDYTKAIERVIKDIIENGYLPGPIKDIIEGGVSEIPDEINEISIEERLASVGGESADILLSKEANSEQLEIARRIEKYNAVLVQGPPGTGKTHTIANLLGHFLAQGKNVLVTSHTSKALAVLKDKLVPGIQDLCVSLIESSNKDMEHSIDGITEFMGKANSFSIKKEMDKLQESRKKVIKELAKVRKTLFTIINQESNSIVYNGESISPSEIAKFVQDNSDKLSYIPGRVELDVPLPLNFTELTELYQSNKNISVEEESELRSGIPDPKELLNPDAFDKKCNELVSLKNTISVIAKTKEWVIKSHPIKKEISFSGDFGNFSLKYPSVDLVKELRNDVQKYANLDPWMQYCAIDGKKGGAYRERWNKLIGQIEETCEFAEKVAAAKFGKEVIILSEDSGFEKAIKHLRDNFSQDGKINKLAFLFNKKSLEIALNGASINGRNPQSREDCELIINILKLDSLKKQCALYWDELIYKHQGKKFFDLDQDDPENIASKYIPIIKQYLEWYANDYEVIKDKIDSIGISSDIVFRYNSVDSEMVSTIKILSTLENDIPYICDAIIAIESKTELSNEINQYKRLLQKGERINSKECNDLLTALENDDPKSYREVYLKLENTYNKTNLSIKREEYLDRLYTVAPRWVEAIRKHEGIHGDSIVPEDILEAWKWKQYYGKIEEIIKEPFADLQEKSINLSKEYRKVTAEYAEKSAWYHLLRKAEADIDMKQALNGWKTTVKRIGKGTGKNAPYYRAEARRLMVKCQKAVPAWIMTINKALESLDPINNKFDVVIIDEASQANITSLAILHMGKKLVIVGDDKQVSPMGIGVDIDKINSLRDMYISNKIPNAHLYDLKASIYDIAATTFHSLMLREHFRCVPEIISFSNWLSYDNKIKPLRDSSQSNLLPAVVNYRVADGQREGKRNRNEAKTIVALLKACLKQSEYSDKTFGIISLLGEEQAVEIEREINTKIDIAEQTKHKILCGVAANFQGDERDVIFLSLVDSGDEQGPLGKREFGPDDSYRKRYNVATSRARDQLWVVDSLDPENDLKSGDIRKMLIEFSLNPKSIEMQNAIIEEKAESPFESAVAKYLAARGYHLEQQWPVGAYRLDMVVICGEKKIAIECDGERFHSGEEKIREDMERQTILERLGWLFIRIRGSEYYCEQEKTMSRVLQKLKDEGIEPEDNNLNKEVTNRETDLLQRVKQQADEYLKAWNNGIDINDKAVDADVVSAALDTKKDKIVSQTKSSKLFIEKAKSIVNDAPKRSTQSLEKPIKTNGINPVKMDVTYDNHYSFPKYSAAHMGSLITKYLPKDFIGFVKAVLEVESPLSEDFLLERIAKCYGYSKLPDVFIRRYNSAMINCREHHIIRKNGFLYLDNHENIRFRVLGGIYRPIKYISVEELLDGMYGVIKEDGEMGRERLYRKIIELCGARQLDREDNKRLDEAFLAMVDHAN